MYNIFTFYKTGTKKKKKNPLHSLSRLPVSVIRHLGIVLDKHLGKQQLEPVDDYFTKPGPVWLFHPNYSTHSFTLA